MTVLTVQLAASLDFPANLTAQKHWKFHLRTDECLIDLVDDWLYPFTMLTISCTRHLLTSESVVPWFHNWTSLYSVKWHNKESPDAQSLFAYKSVIL